MNDAAQIFAISFLILCISFGCSHCKRTDFEIEQKKAAISQPTNPTK